MIRPALLLAVAVATPLHAQPRAARPASAAPGSVVREAWTQVQTFLARAATAVPDSSYAYKPAPTVRSFGELIAHVAGAQRAYCGAALGEPAPSEENLEKTLHAKADLVKALDASNAYCTRAYALPPARMAESVQVFGERHTREYALLGNVTHDYEHYGNVVTYMRMLGMVPPSSQPTP